MFETGADGCARAAPPNAPKAPAPAPDAGLALAAPQIPACAFSLSRSLIDFAPTAGVPGLLADADPPSDIDHRSSKFALAPGFGVPLVVIGDVAFARAGCEGKMDGCIGAPVGDMYVGVPANPELPMLILFMFICGTEDMGDMPERALCAGLMVGTGGLIVVCTGGTMDWRDAC